MPKRVEAMSFESLLDSIRGLSERPLAPALRHERGHPTLWSASLGVEPTSRDRLVASLEQTSTDALRTYDVPLTPQSVWGATRNFHDRCPKVMRCRSAMLNDARCGAARNLAAIGAWPILAGDWARTLAERALGVVLGRRCGRQVIRYAEGDYVGAHHDYLPESPNLKKGYVDVQLGLPGSGVRRQRLLYEHGGHLNAFADVGEDVVVNVYRLPFWHAVSPLEVDPRKGQRTRWLFLQSFELA